MIHKINQQTNLVETKDTVYLSFKALEELDFIYHGFSTKLGGVSDDFMTFDDETGIRDSLRTSFKGFMNLGFNQEKNPENVLQNFDIISNAIGFTKDSIVLPNQQHTIAVRKVGKANKGEGIFTEKPTDPVDAQITDEEGVTLLIYGADCPTVFFADPVKRAIGIAHSGWKGTYHNISGAVIDRMVTEYSCNPADIRAVIGPHIGQECYEIGEDVAVKFKERMDLERDLPSDVLQRGKEQGKYYLSMKAVIIHDLLKAGLQSDHVTSSDFCTKCNKAILYSNRNEGTSRGSLAGMIGIKVTGR